MKEDHQQTIEEKNVALALLTDDLQDRDNRIQAIQYENVALQAQRDMCQIELQRCQGTITHIRARYVGHIMREIRVKTILSSFCKNT